jgi:hypothetical protein
MSNDKLPCNGEVNKKKIVVSIFKNLKNNDYDICRLNKKNN